MKCAKAPSSGLDAPTAPLKPQPAAALNVLVAGGTGPVGSAPPHATNLVVHHPNYEGVSPRLHCGCRKHAGGVVGDLIAGGQGRGWVGRKGSACMCGDCGLRHEATDHLEQLSMCEPTESRPPPTDPHTQPRTPTHTLMRAHTGVMLTDRKVNSCGVSDTPCQVRLRAAQPRWASA
jgi:hypothetical protein